MSMGTNKIAIGISAGLVGLVALIYYAAGPGTAIPLASASKITIEDTWELPAELAEISGIAFLGAEKIVGVQDEKGALFIYNLATRKLEKQIEFGPNGDYEGVAVNGSTAYVLRTDGTIIVIEDYLTETKVSEIKTGLTEKEDPEGLCLDEKNNRLLIAIKGNDPNSETSKGIYGLDLPQKKLEDTPIFNIDFKDPVFKEIKEEELQDTFKPSEINIHPETGQIYLLEGQDPKLLILDPEGNPVKLISLEKEDFPQPEGLTFDPDGNLYISNEGKPGTIYRISIK